MTLQLAMILLGALVLAAVTGVSLWQQRNNQRPIIRRFQVWVSKQIEEFNLEDIKNRLKPQRIAARLAQREPSLMPSADFEPGSTVPEPATSTDHEPSNTEENSGVNQPVRQVQSLNSEIGGRPLKLDYWIRLAGKSLVSRDTALAIFRQHEIPLERPRAIHGRTDPGNAWLDLTTAPVDEVFSDLIISLQMADRHGQTNESELTRFNNIAYQMSEALNRPMEFDMSIEEALPEAARLARFCTEYDLIAVIHIEPRPGSGFRGPDVARVLERSGMRLGKDEVFHLFDARTGISRFSLANRSEEGRFSYEDLGTGVLRGLAIFMNVPRVSRPSATFSDLMSVANYVCAELDGVLVDPEGEAISENHLEAIRRQVHSLEASMRRYGIEAGSEEARRLF
ncbi:MAG: hypothetical protein EBT18_02570 [Gammaproteobacteria bacterium]|nr:hypothetical protein [Gammaproteobacteria bacterium]